MKFNNKRRQFLRGFGTALTLPIFESLLPSKVFAAEADKKRFAMVYTPNGMITNQFFPQQEGALGQLPTILSPLEAFKDKLVTIQGLSNKSADKASNGGHARASGSFLSNVPILESKTVLGAAKSMDQKIAEGLNDLSSLHLGIENYGCDTFACDYSRGLSWSADAQLKPRAISPQQVYNQMVGGIDPNNAQAAIEERKALRKSVLDYVKQDTEAVKLKLGQSDRAKMEQWLENVRSVEQKIDAMQAPQCTIPEAPNSNNSVQAIDAMLDLMVLAFQCDITQVAVFMMGDEGSNINFNFLNGVSGNHHDISHHGNDPGKIAQLVEINRWETEKFAGFLGKLAAVDLGGQTLLDNSLIMYGGGISNSNTHSHSLLPILLAGGASSAELGRHIKVADNTPLANLHLTVMNKMGINAASHGDSTGMINNL